MDNKERKTAEEIKDLVQEEYRNGNIVFASLEGLHRANFNEFMKQPIDGILYDLNRSEEVILTFIDDPRWVNDFAACKVIRNLHQETSLLRERVEELEKALENAHQVVIALSESKRVVNLDEAIAYYESILSKIKTNKP